MPVIHRVDGDGHVSRLVGTRVDVAVVLGKKVDVVEHVAVVGVKASRFVEADVHQHRAVERYFRLLQAYRSRRVEQGAVPRSAGIPAVMKAISPGTVLDCHYQSTVTATD